MCNFHHFGYTYLMNQSSALTPATLKRIFPFSLLDESDLRTILPLIETIDLSSDSRIYQTGDVPNALYFILSGGVRLIIPDPVQGDVETTLTVGDHLGAEIFSSTDYRRNDYTFRVIYSAIHQWMRSQDTQEVRNEWSIYKTPKYYEFQRKVKREQRRNGCATNLNSIRVSVDAIASQATKIERLIADYNAAFGEQLPVEYTEIQMPTIPNQR